MLRDKLWGSMAESRSVQILPQLVWEFIVFEGEFLITFPSPKHSTKTLVHLTISFQVPKRSPGLGIHFHRMLRCDIDGCLPTSRLPGD